MSRVSITKSEIGFFIYKKRKKEFKIIYRESIENMETA